MIWRKICARCRPARFHLALGDGIDSAPNDFNGVGATVQGQRNDGGDGGIELDADLRQGEEDEEYLHQKRRIADGFHKADDDAAQQPETRASGDNPENPDDGGKRHAGNGKADRRQTG